MKTRQLARNLMLLLTIGLVATGIGNAWADTQRISLSSGWNFISLQIEPDVPIIGNVLSGLDVESVWYYDAIRAMNDMDPWLCHKPDNPPFVNNLYEINARKGYWIEMHSPGTLNIVGQIPTTSIICYPGYDGEMGWNAVGFFSPTNNYTVEEILESDVYDSIWGYNPASDSFIQLDTDDVLEPGKAYWIETSKGFELAPDIEVSPTVFHFGSRGEKGLMQLRNRGDGEIDWQATAYTDDGWNWLGLKKFLDDEEDPATQLTGWVSFYYKPIYIFIDRGGLAPGEYTGHIRVVASAKPEFPVDVEVTMTVEPIGGDYSGTLVINKVDGKNIPEISTRLFASIHYDANEGIDVMTVINSEKSLIFPHDPILSGGIIDTNTSLFSVAGTLLLAKEKDPFNPYTELEKEISRQIWLETTMVGSGNNMLGGVYRETIQGMLGKSIEVEGLFQLHKVDDTPSQDASDRFGYLEGTVIDDVTGQPISGATVILTGTGITEYCTTLGNGAFSFYVPDFAYLLNVQAPGYESVHQNVIFDHTSPESITMRLVPLTEGTIITDFVESTHDPVEIPDATAPDIPGETLESYLTVDQAGAIESLIVFLDISHDDISELVVTLISPEGTSCTLHNRTSGQNLIGAFYIEDDFLGENPKGTWTLRITDYAPDNKGMLNSWSLTVNLVSGTVAGTWTTDLAPMPGPGRWLGSSGSPVLDGMIYVLGPGNSAYGYIPETDSWIELEPMPGSAVGVAAINESIYAIGPEHTFQWVSSATEGLVGYWSFDNGDATDDSGNGNNGTVHGATLTEDRFGNTDSAYSFDGVDDYIEVPDSSGLDIVKEISITGWVNVNSYTDEWLGIVNKADSDGNDTFEICINSSGYIHFPLKFQTSGRLSYNSDPGCFKEGEWHFFGTVYNGTHVEIYVDGVLTNSYASTDEPLNTNNHSLIIGAEGESYNGPHPFNGVLDEIRIYNRALSESEIKQLYAQCESGSTIYSSDFESGVGSEWSSNKRDTTPVGDRNFLGQLGYETVILTLNDLPLHTQVTVSFDLFIINSWDGNHAAWGPDIWDLSVTNGPTLLHTTFSNIEENPVDHPQAYPDNYPGGNHSPCAGAIEVDSLGYTYYGDSVYHLSYTFSHCAPLVQLSFSASMTEGLSDESWGLDNVEVRVNGAGIDWIEKTPMPVSVTSFGYAVVDNQIYIVGGDISGSSSTTFQRYTPATDTWEADTNHGGTLAPLPQSRSSLYCGVINGKIHAIGGRNDADPTCDHFIYDPDTNTWSAGPPIPQCFIGQFAATSNNAIYVFGGDQGDGQDYVYKYSEAQGWSSDTAMPTGRIYGTTAVYNGRIYVIGGESQGQPLDIVEVYDLGYGDAIALFTENPREGMAPLTVEFSAFSDQATDWVWDFGDEYDPTSGSGKEPTHTYSQPGNYTVSLTATGPGGSGAVTKRAHIRVSMSTGPGDSSSSFKWTALALSGEDGDTPPIANDSNNSMTAFIGHPVIGGTSLEGYVSQTRRGDQIMWSGPLPIQ